MRWLGAGSLPLVFALSIQSGSNLGFHVLVSRILGPSRYGELAALLALVLVFAVPATVTQTIAAKNVARLRTERGERALRDLVAAMAKTVGYAGVVLLPVSLLLVPVISDFLCVTWSSAILVGPYLLVTLLAGLALGGLQGSGRFGALGLAVAVGVLVRFVTGLALTSGGLGVAGAMIATVLAPAVTGGIAFGVLSIHRPMWARARASLDPFRTDFRPAVLALGSFALATQLDMILARHFLDAHDAGVYSGAGLVARGILFVPAAVATAVFPRFVELRARGARARRWLHVSMAATMLVAAIALAAMQLFGRGAIGIVLGERFQSSTTLFVLVGGAISANALTNLLIQFHIAAETHASRILLIGAAIEAMLVLRFHSSPEQLAAVSLAVASASAAALYHSARAASSSAAAGSALCEQAPSDLDVTVVLPCHNSGTALSPLLRELCTQTLPPRSFEVIVVSDGSTDDTVAIARAAGSEVRVIEQDERCGKGNALRLGLSVARGRYIAFMDSDGDIHPGDLRSLLSVMDVYEPDVVVGSKRHPLSCVEYPASRRIMSWTYHKLTRVLFRVNVRDTQTGLKVIRRDVLAAALPRMLEKRFAFDLELLVVTRMLGHKRVFEAPVRIDYQFRSHIDLRQTLRIIGDTLAIFHRRFVLASYDRPSLAGPLRPRATQRTATGAGTSRILFINWRDIRNPAAGGAEVFTHEVAKRWVARGHHVELLTSRFPGCTRVECVDGVVVRRVGAFAKGTLHLRVQQQLARLRDFDLVIDEINVVGFFTPVWRRRLPPIVALVHQLPTDVWDAELPRVLADVGRWIEPRLLRLYADIPTVTVSDSTRSDLLRVGIDTVEVIPEGLDARPVLADEPWDGVPSVLFVGRLARNKRPADAIEAFRRIKAHLPDARLDIVGRGALEGELAGSLPDGAVMHGFVERDELYRLMARARCLLVPSVREGFGLVVAEANSVGTPAVGYDVPGLRDSITHGHTGILVPDGDVDAMARAGLSILTNATKRHRFSIAARSAVSGLSWDATACRFLEVVTSWGMLPDATGRTAAPARIDDTDAVAGEPVADSARLPVGAVAYLAET